MDMRWLKEYEENEQRTRAATKRATDSMMEMQRRKNNPNIAVFETLDRIIRDFQAGLSSDEEVGMYVGNMPSPFRVRSIQCESSSLLLFEGIDDEGGRVTALQHVTQLSFQLVAKAKVAEEAFRIGFFQGGDAPE